MRNRCDTCDFFAGGLCHRYPPVYMGRREVTVDYNRDNYRAITEDQDFFGYPEVDKTDWCGEWCIRKDQDQHVFNTVEVSDE